ncbi:hypothetical protein CCR94_23030 [Rhodoblastus sphagnicola]|uniref:Uncharacterized protein n=1 Tax=Rhodoblastus sphagnicola TaxID=333368 RepID=A0A2S6MUV7_9HYPH|nr:copper homeostasis periplasmic binding protein CopC [Rhodoblastus sphagnicola]MBB4199819.1 hypothetical protein [Rhodoblastus sphagnicola]PPQ26139.1 hypothetical protein CCR94_23030 [Rhodoblastus sphagnicola]
MKKIVCALLAGGAGFAAVTGAFAHALLDHAVPGVGSTVQSSPRELEISFTQNIVASFSGATLTTADGAALAAGKGVVDPSNPSALRVPIGHALKPGTYVVNWHVVSVDTHHTSGSYKFTVAP